MTLQEWTSKAVASHHVELKNLAKSLLQDAEAITAAMTESWSNGQVEGQVGRLKQIKRRMYGQHLARHDVVEGEDPAQGIRRAFTKSAEEPLFNAEYQRNPRPQTRSGPRVVCVGDHMSRRSDRPPLLVTRIARGVRYEQAACRVFELLRDLLVTSRDRLREFLEHYDAERPHQAKGNVPLTGGRPKGARGRAGHIWRDSVRPAVGRIVV